MHISSVRTSYWQIGKIHYFLPFSYYNTVGTYVCSSDDEEVIQRRKEARLLAEIAEAEKKARRKAKHKKRKSKKHKHIR